MDLPRSLLYLFFRGAFRLVVRRRDLVSQLELEVVVLRQQVSILRRHSKHPRITDRDRAFLTAAARRMSRPSWSILIVTPQPILRWHQRLAARRWANYSKRRRGRPGLDPDTKELIVRMGKENPRWGYRRIHGELKNLGFDVSATTVRRVLRAHRIPPVPEHPEPTWSEFLSAQAKTILATDFFTVESLFLRRYYVLFFIEIATRRVHYAGSTRRPNGAWVTQMARNLAMSLDLDPFTILIRDRDSKFSGSLDQVFVTEGLAVVKTPYRSPRANAFVERWVKSARTECLDLMLILGHAHLDAVMREYVEHYNSHRPHRSLDQAAPIDDGDVVDPGGRIVRSERLGGLIHEYVRQAA